MKKLQWTAGLGLVALLVVSCKSNVTQAPAPQPAVKPVSASPEPATTNASGTKVPEVPQGLISATNPTQINITAGRSDPFKTVVIPSIKLPPTPERTNQGKVNADKTKQNQTNKGKTNQNQANQHQTNQNQANQNQANQRQTNQNQANQRQTNQNQANQNQVNQNQTNQNQANEGKPNRGNTGTPNENIAIKTPSTSLATAIEVTGVVQVGGRVSAIVKESNGKTSRYVTPGEYLSNGAVLVKRIQVDSNQEPVVVLEQNGVEVIKPVSGTNEPVASLQ